MLLELDEISDKRHQPIRSHCSFHQRPQSAYLKRRLGVDGILFYSLTAQQHLRFGVICDLLPFREPLGLGRCQNTLTLKEALSDRTAFLDSGMDKATRHRKPMRVLGAGSNNYRDFHSLNKKNPGVAGALARVIPFSVVTAGKHGDEME